MISEKVKALLSLSGKRQTALADYFGVCRQSMNNKIRLNRFSGEDLIKIADFTGAKLLFELPNGQKIFMDTADLTDESTIK